MRAPGSTAKLVCTIYFILISNLRPLYECAVTSVPDSGDVVVGVCPGESVSFTCSHNQTSCGVSRWISPGSDGCLIAHDGTAPPACNNFTISMISDQTSPMLSFTAQATATSDLDGVMVQCRAGGLFSSPLIGSRTITFIGPPTIPTIDSISYSVGSATTGSVRFTATSTELFGTVPSLTASVNSSRSSPVTVNEGTVSVGGLEYGAHYVIEVVASVCPSELRSTSTFPVIINTEAPVLSSPTASLVCSNPRLPIQLDWTLAGTLSSDDPLVPLNPPPNALYTIRYITAGGRSGTTNSDFSVETYQLSIPALNDTYTLTVEATNVAGTSSFTSNEVLTAAMFVDESTVLSSGCFTVNISEACAEDVTTGMFSVMLESAFGDCATLRSDDFTIRIFPLSALSTCVPAGSGGGEFCYRATLMHLGGEISSRTNLNFPSCPSPSFTTSDITISYNSALDLNGNLPHHTTATFSCDSPIHELSGPPTAECSAGSWVTDKKRSCTVTVLFIAAMSSGCFVLLAVVIGGGCVFQWKRRRSAKSPEAET